MITTLNPNAIAFGSNSEYVFRAFKQPVMQTQRITTDSGTEDVIKNKGIKGRINKARVGFLNLIKDYNIFSETAKGTVKGVGYGIGTTVLVGFVGKNIQQGKGQIGDSLVGMIKDIGKSVLKVPSILAKVFTESPIENIKALKDIPSKFYEYCASGVKNNADTVGNEIKKIKGSKTVGIIATLAGIGVLGYNIIKGKLKGNHASAEVDHYTNNGHVKIKA